MSVKERIIKTLLESPKLTREITVALGHEPTKYNAVDKDLKTLQSTKFIHYEKIKIPGKTGPVAKTYDIVYELPTIKKILDKYPALTSDLQKNEIILYMLVEKHRKLLYPFQVGKPNDEELKEYNDAFLLDYIHDFKDSLSLSQTLFKMCISYEPKKITAALVALMSALDLIEYTGFLKMSLIEHLNKNGTIPADFFYHVCRVFDRLNEP